MMINTKDNNLRTARERKGLSVRGLARLSGVDHSFISRIENNKCRLTAETARKLAKALGLKFSALYTWED